MRSILSAVNALILAAALCVPACAQEVLIYGPQTAELTEGREYIVEWSAGGAETVDITLTGTRIALGGKPRGDFEIVLAKGVPAVDGTRALTMPWADALKVRLRVVGRDGAGTQVAAAQKEYRFRPASLADRTADGIYVDLHAKTNQRLYVLKDGVVAKAYPCSSSSAYRWLPTNVHPVSPHDHAGVFRVLGKSARAYSRQYDVEMPWALHYLAGHFIHATSPQYYKLLGQPASHGCVRLTREDAKELFDNTPTGARIEVIGPQTPAE